MHIAPLIVRHQALREAMELRQKTPDDLSKETGLDSQQIVSLIESDSPMAPADLGRLALTLGVIPMTLTDDPRMRVF